MAVHRLDKRVMLSYFYVTRETGDNAIGRSVPDFVVFSIQSEPVTPHGPVFFERHGPPAMGAFALGLGHHRNHFFGRNCSTLVMYAILAILLSVHVQFLPEQGRPGA
jgi:hypothetical protein